MFWHAGNIDAWPLKQRDRRWNALRVKSAKGPRLHDAQKYLSPRKIR
jgi:hypothetical protein